MQTWDPILERVLWLSNESRKSGVVIRIGRPYPVDEGRNFVCPFEIEGLNVTKLRSAMGVDAIQSLWAALRVVGASLYASDEYKSGRLRWFVDQDDLGFPTA